MHVMVKDVDVIFLKIDKCCNYRQLPALDEIWELC